MRKLSVLSVLFVMALAKLTALQGAADCLNACTNCPLAKPEPFKPTCVKRKVEAELLTTGAS